MFTWLGSCINVLKLPIPLFGNRYYLPLTPTASLVDGDERDVPLMLQVLSKRITHSLLYI